MMVHFLTILVLDSNIYHFLTIFVLDTDITKEEYIEFRSKQFESEKVVDKVTEDEEIRAKQEVRYIFVRFLTCLLYF